jgi:hypothetical protein
LSTCGAGKCRPSAGEEGWLFYKPELTGACRSGAATKRVIDVADAMRVYAAGAGIELTVSVSPDKSVVYADRLGARAELIAGCKGRLAAAWRTYAQRVGSHVIDHLSDLRQVEGQIDLYYPTDTHWNDYGIAFAMRGLAQQYLGVDPGAPGASDVVSSLLATDLSRMLKYSDGDVSPTVPRYWERFEQAIGPGVAGVTVLHDSFYTKARQGLRMLFPDGTFVIRGATDDSIRLALESRPKRLLINVVERSMVLAFLHGGFAWDAALGRYVLEANAAEASACQAYAIPTSGVKTSGRRASVRIRLPEGGRPCIRITSYSALGASA